jgi:cytochrome c556
MDRIRRTVMIGLSLSLVAVGACTPGAPPEGEPSEPATDTGAAASDETLVTVMAGLRADMVRLTDGVWRDDFEAVADAAEAVAEHPQVGAEERMRVQAALGEEFPDFVALDHRVHDLALGVRDAALREDTSAVLSGLAELQRGCVACHAEYRAKLTR